MQRLMASPVNGQLITPEGVEMGLKVGNLPNMISTNEYEYCVRIKAQYNITLCILNYVAYNGYIVV